MKHCLIALLAFQALHGSLTFPAPTTHEQQIYKLYAAMPMRGRWDRALNITVYETPQTFDWGEDNGPIWFLDNTGIEYQTPEIVLKDGPDAPKEFVFKYGLVMYYSVLTPSERNVMAPLDFAKGFVDAYAQGFPSSWNMTPYPLKTFIVKRMMGQQSP